MQYKWWMYFLSPLPLPFTEGARLFVLTVFQSWLCPWFLDNLTFSWQSLALLRPYHMSFLKKIFLSALVFLWSHLVPEFKDTLTAVCGLLWSELLRRPANSNPAFPNAICTIEPIGPLELECPRWSFSDSSTTWWFSAFPRLLLFYMLKPRSLSPSMASLSLVVYARVCCTFEHPRNQLSFLTPTPWDWVLLRPLSKAGVPPSVPSQELHISSIQLE